jgi:hypothetical protein
MKTLSSLLDVCVDDRPEGLAVPENPGLTRFKDLRETLAVLVDSTERLQRIQEQHEALLCEIDRTIELRPAHEHQILELVSSARCDDLNLACIQALEQIGDSLRVRAEALSNGHIQ